MSPHVQMENPEDAADAYQALVRQALDSVEHALSLVPIQCLADVDEAERAIVRLRDRLIEDLRKDQPGASSDRLRPVLERANVALSLVVGVEYPATGSQRKMLEMARDTLQDAVGRLA